MHKMFTAALAVKVESDCLSWSLPWDRKSPSHCVSNDTDSVWISGPHGSVALLGS